MPLDTGAGCGYDASNTVTASTHTSNPHTAPQRPAPIWPAGVLSLGLLVFRVLAAFAVPTDGMILSRSVSPQGAVGEIYQVLHANGSTITAGDRVLEMDGRTIADWFERLAQQPWALDPGPETGIFRMRVGDAGGIESVQQVQLSRRLIHACHSDLLSCSGPSVYAVLSLALGIWVVSRKPREPAAQLLFLTGCAACLYILYGGMPAQLQLLRRPALIWFNSVVIVTSMLFVATGIVHLLLLLPFSDGGHATALAPPAWVLHLVPQAALWLAWLGARPLYADAYTWIAALGRMLNGIVGLVLLLGLSALLLRHRELVDDRQRRQFRAVGLGMLAIVLATVLLVRLPTMAGRPLVDGGLAAWFIIPYPVFLAAAILRYRFFNITYLLSRTLVYGALTALLVAFTAALVFVANRALLLALGEGSNVLITALGIVVCVFAFQPLRMWLQRAVNRWMYGDRDEPDAVLARMTRQMDTTAEQASALPAIAEIVARALRLPWAELRVPGQPAARWSAPGAPRETGVLKSIALTHNRSEAGELLLGARPDHDPFGPADERLLADLARQAGIAAFLTRQSSELQRSRERIVSTREEERLRIRRDLHDGLGPSLGSLVMGLDTAHNLLGRSPAAAGQLLLQLRDHAHGIVGDVRGLVYDLRPPELDQLGLLPALRERAARLERAGAEGGALQIEIVAAALPALPAAHEVALYRLISEALHNVARHAHARRCTVTLACDGAAVCARIRDDGTGLAPGTRMGVGLGSMRERMLELGGSLSLVSNDGLLVEARLPIPV